MMYQQIIDQIQALDIDSISEERKQTLQPFITYVKSKVKEGQSIRLNFICTHNSRRSHLSQIWAQTMAAFYNIDKVTCYSGGTEATAMFPKVGETLEAQGFNITKLSDGSNPIYSVKYADNDTPIIAFSKEFSDSFNPTSAFAAIMTCSSADEGCPFVLGSDQRIAVTYDDPKISDGTPQQSATYLARSLQIATEMKYVFSKVI